MWRRDTPAYSRLASKVLGTVISNSVPHHRLAIYPHRAATARAVPRNPFPLSSVRPQNTRRRKMMDHSTHERLRQDELIEDVLVGATIYGPEDETIGTVSHMHGNSVALDVGGFLGIGSKRIAVPVSELDFMRDENGNVHAVTSWTKEQLEQLPEHFD